MKTTPLIDEHIKLKAKLVDFAGYNMPIQYENLKNEAQAVRDKVGMFDVSHMGEFWVKGKDAEKFVDYIIANDFLNLKESKAIYSTLLNHEGKILDDLIAYKLSKQEVLICVNASNIEKDFKWISQFAHQFDIKLTNESEDYSLIAVQGPQSFKVLKELNYFESLNDIDYYSIQRVDIEQDSVLLARTGYTGEDGFEIFASHALIKMIWQDLLNKDVKPCGLGARDVLRLEAGFPLYGNELNDQMTPLDCGLKWATKLNKDRFIGKEALVNYSPEYKLIKLSLEKAIPRAGYRVFLGEQIIGEITSGTQSIVLNKGIAFARVNNNIKLNDEDLFVEIRNKKYNAQKHVKAFISQGVKK